LYPYDLGMTLTIYRAVQPQFLKEGTD